MFPRGSLPCFGRAVGVERQGNVPHSNCPALAANVWLAAVAGFWNCALSHLTKRNYETQTTKQHRAPPLKQAIVASSWVSYVKGVLSFSIVCELKTSPPWQNCLRRLFHCHLSQSLSFLFSQLPAGWKLLLRYKTVCGDYFCHLSQSLSFLFFSIVCGLKTSPPWQNCLRRLFLSPVPKSFIFIFSIACGLKISPPWQNCLRRLFLSTVPKSFILIFSIVCGLKISPPW